MVKLTVCFSTARRQTKLGSCKLGAGGAAAIKLELEIRDAEMEMVWRWPMLMPMEGNWVTPADGRRLGPQTSSSVFCFLSQAKILTLHREKLDQYSRVFLKTFDL